MELTRLSAEVNALGVHLALTLYAENRTPITHLLSLGIHTIRLDSRLVDKVLTDPRASIFCKGIITMAHELGVRVIADGVRSDHQAQFLTILGCDAVQRESSVDGPGSSTRGDDETTSMLQPQLASGGLKGSQPRPEGAEARLPGHQPL